MITRSREIITRSREIIKRFSFFPVTLLGFIIITRYRKIIMRSRDYFIFVVALMYFRKKWTVTQATKNEACVWLEVST